MRFSAGSGALLLGVWFLALSALASPNQMERMLVKKTRMLDQDGSATGYSYEQRHGLPVSFVQYTTHAEPPVPGPRKPEATDAYPTFTSYRSYPVYTYGDHNQNNNYQYDYDYAPFVSGEALAPYYPLPYLQPPHHQQLAVHRYGEPHLHEVHHHGVEDSDEHGAEHNAEDHEAHGEKSEKGYGAHHDFDLADNEHREADHSEGEYKDEAGHEGGHEESHAQYDSHDKTEAGQEGANYGNKSYQKKGHRTSGFHNVYRKDEYKKDTDFYDEDHDGGHYEKYGAFDAHRSDEVGGREKAGKHDSAFAAERRGQAGSFDRGHNHNLHRGHEGASGEDAYREEHAGYSSRADRQHAHRHR